MKTAKEYRVEANNALPGNWALAIAISVVNAIALYLANMTIVGIIVLGGALELGYSIAFINLFRRGKMSFEDLFTGFSTGNFVSTIGLYVKRTIFTFLWTLLFIIPGIVKGISYSMAPYILADHPEMTGGEAIKASNELMNGKKWNLFCLELSFIGWYLLSILTFGILLIWVAPWVRATEAAFYESIKHEVPTAVIENDSEI